LIAAAVETRNTAGEKIAFNQTVVFLQRAGGFGGRRTSDKLKPTAEPPKRPPCASIQEKTSVDQVCFSACCFGRLTGMLSFMVEFVSSG
jgi:(3R)-3-hydroxyacyl-CoA dehydrogenase / 3a,7a,12a-trihydroxy-5b-cholest-24-enoyl-CoA hydratase / enoyl-CoA hydratase 2